MSDQLFIVLRVCLLALVYLVFLRVLRAVWMELQAESTVVPSTTVPAASSRPRAPAPMPVAASAPTMVPSTAARLVVIAPATLVGHSFALNGETTIGRGAGCGVSIDDAHVSKVHARLSPHEGGWLLADLGSTNGTMLNGSPVLTPTPIGPGGRITIGEIVLELS